MIRYPIEEVGSDQIMGNSYQMKECEFYPTGSKKSKQSKEGEWSVLQSNKYHSGGCRDLKGPKNKPKKQGKQLKDHISGPDKRLCRHKFNGLAMEMERK